MKCFLGWILKIRKWWFHPPKKLPGICISVGNLRWGGTGKTPLVQEIAKYWTQKGEKCAILTRGYKSSLKGFAVYEEGQCTQFTHHLPHADEAAMMSHSLPGIPIILGKNRYEAAKWFLNLKKRQISFWILDDGFQHVKLFRDMDILTIPVEDWIFHPPFFMREPWSSWKKAHMIFITGKCHEKLSLPENVFHVSSFLDTPFSIKENRFMKKDDQPVVAACGIARPLRFFKDLKELGIHVQREISFGDHSLLHFKDKIFQGAKSLVVTSKDYWRDPSLFQKLPVPCFVAPLKMPIPNLAWKFMENILRSLKDDDAFIS